MGHLQYPIKYLTYVIEIIYRRNIAGMVFATLLQLIDTNFIEVEESEIMIKDYV